MAALDVAGPVLGNRKHNLVMHDQYMKKYEEMQKTFSHRSLQLKREERELHKKLEAIVGRSSGSYELTKTISLEPLSPSETSSRQQSRARTPFPRDKNPNFRIPSPPKGRPKSTVRGRRLSVSSESYETKSEGRASPVRQRSPERGQPSVNGEDSEMKKRMLALSRRRNTVCSGVLKVQLEKFSHQCNDLIKDTKTEQPPEVEKLSKSEGDEESSSSDQSDSVKEIKENGSENSIEEFVSNTAIPKPKHMSAIFCYKYEEGKEETEGTSVLVNSKFKTTPIENTMPSNESASTDSETDQQSSSVLQENSNSKVSRKMSVMSPVQECDGVEEEDNASDEPAWNGLAKQTNGISSEQPVASNILAFHKNHPKSQKNGNSKFGRKLSLMSPVQESDWTEENSSVTSDANEMCIREVQSVNANVPADSVDSTPVPPQTITLNFPVKSTPLSDNSENPLKSRIDSKIIDGSKTRPTSSMVQRGRSPVRRLSRSLESSASPPAGKARLMHRRRSLDPNMLADMKQFQNNSQVQLKPERQQPLNSLRRRTSVCDPSFQGIDMVGVDVGREKFKSIARRMLALSRGHQKDENDEKDKTEDVPQEWRDIEKCRYLRSYVPKWDRE